MSHIRGISEGRLGRRNVLIVFGLGFAVIVGIAAGIAALAAPGTGGVCPPYRPCGPPSSTPLVETQVWRSAQYGYAFAYPGASFSIEQQNAAGVILKLTDGRGLLIVSGSPAAQGSTSSAVTREASALSRTLSGLSADAQPQDRILGSNVGFRSGAWGVYAGTFAGPEAPNRPTNVAIQAASDGKVTITTTALDFTASTPGKSAPFQEADTVFDTIQWAP